MEQLSISLKLEIQTPYLLSNLAEIWHRGKIWDADYEFKLKIRYEYDLSQKNAIFTEILKNWSSAPLQKCCHSNAFGYSGLKTVSNDALYNFTKSQKVSSANY